MNAWIAITGLILNLAQPEAVEMADDYRGEGKIYVLVAIVLLILAGLFVYLFRLERKIKKLEK